MATYDCARGTLTATTAPVTAHVSTGPTTLRKPTRGDMAKLKEVQYDYYVGQHPEYGPPCHHCGALTERSTIPCPDPPRYYFQRVHRGGGSEAGGAGPSQAGAVVHIGWACRRCVPNRYYVEVEEGGS